MVPFLSSAYYFTHSFSIYSPAFEFDDFEPCLAELDRPFLILAIELRP